MITHRIGRVQLHFHDAADKISRDAFLYLEPTGADPDFAQCGDCILWVQDNHCMIHGPDVPVTADMSCGFFIQGPSQPPGTTTKALVTPEQSGAVKRKVRCENCRSFDGTSICLLYDALNKSEGDKFDLDVNVKPQACCNAQMPKA